MSGYKQTIIRKTFDTCSYCGCKSKVETRQAGIGGGGTWLVCPGDLKYPKLHSELTDKIDKLEESGHPKNYIEELKKEINEIKDKFKDIAPLEKA